MTLECDNLRKINKIPTQLGFTKENCSPNHLINYLTMEEVVFIQAAITWKDFAKIFIKVFLVNQLEKQMVKLVSTLKKIWQLIRWGHATDSFLFHTYWRMKN